MDEGDWAATDCWPETAKRVPHGTFTVGLGRGGYKELPDVAPLEWGIQDGYMFVLSTRMTEFRPGDPNDFTYVANPFTKILAYFDDTNVQLNRDMKCAFRNPYQVTAEGDYVMKQEVGVMFETCWRIDRLVGQRIRIEAEILEPNGNYAHETRVVTAAAPVDPSYPKEQNTAGCLP
jgi:hypothetical protein